MSRFALLLSGSIGAGHDVMAEALADELAARGWRTRTVDCMPLMGEWAGQLGERVFRVMMRIPGLYDAYHYAALRPGNWLAHRTDMAARSRLLPRLARLVAEDPPDLVVAVFATGASAAAALARQGAVPATAVFCTDVTAHRMWVHEGIGAYLMTSPAGAASVRRYQPDARVLVGPAPVRAGFRRPLPQHEARAELGIPLQASAVLLMGGAWGMGPVAETARALARSGVHVLAVAGRNARLERQLRSAAQELQTLHPFGYTDQIPLLMSACDLVITPGGDTCSEARAVGRELLLLDVVPGHGRDNLQHELELGHASVVSADPQTTVAAVAALLPGIQPRPATDPTPAFSAVVSELLSALRLENPAKVGPQTGQ